VRCLHRKSWLLCGGFLEWCYACGAIRQHKRDPMYTNTVTPDGPWQRPVGDEARNPIDTYLKRLEKWRARK
jgi:hypothetical protein